MNKICTSIEQSKKLMELGINLITSDMFWANDILIATPYITKTDIETLIPAYKGAIPAWSFIALNNIIKDNCESCEIHLRNDKKYNIFVTSGTFVYKSFDIYPNGFDELVDAYYEVVCWLKENGKI